MKVEELDFDCLYEYKKEHIKVIFKLLEINSKYVKIKIIEHSNSKYLLDREIILFFDKKDDVTGIGNSTTYSTVFDLTNKVLTILI